MSQVTFLDQGGRTVTAPEGISLLRISLRENGGIPFRCGGGLCGTCKCRIARGLEHTDPVTPKERLLLTAAELAAGYRLACQTFLDGDIAVAGAASPPPAEAPAA